VAFAAPQNRPCPLPVILVYWGGISLFLFLVQCFTGRAAAGLLRPGAEAYESVRQITFVMHFGLVDSLAHAWSASLMIFSILVHMSRSTS